MICSKCCGIKEIIDTNGYVVSCYHCNGTGIEPEKENIKWKKIRKNICKNFLKENNEKM